MLHGRTETPIRPSLRCCAGKKSIRTERQIEVRVTYEVLILPEGEGDDDDHNRGGRGNAGAVGMPVEV